MNTTYFVLYNQMMTMNQMNTMNSILHQNNVDDVSVVITGTDIIIFVLGLILLVYFGIKFVNWILDKCENLPEPWDSIVITISIVTFFGIGLMLICLPFCF